MKRRTEIDGLLGGLHTIHLASFCSWALCTEMAHPKPSCKMMRNKTTEFDKKIFEKVEDVMLEAKFGINARMNKMIIFLVFDCMIMFGVFKVVGLV